MLAPVLGEGGICSGTSLGAEGAVQGETVRTPSAPFQGSAEEELSRMQLNSQDEQGSSGLSRTGPKMSVNCAEVRTIGNPPSEALLCYSHEG